MTEIRVKARLAFQPPFKSKSINNGPEKYRARLMFDPATEWGKESIKLIRETRKAVAKERWKAKADGILETIKGDRNKESWFESDYRSSDGENVDGFEGMFHMSALSETLPLMIDRDRTEVTARDGRFYSGCYVVAKLDIYPQDNEHGKGMRCGLMGLQFWKDGDAFGGGRRASADDFDDLSDTGEEDEDETPRRTAPSRGSEGSGAGARARRAPVEDDDDDIA